MPIGNETIRKANKSDRLTRITSVCVLMALLGGCGGGGTSSTNGNTQNGTPPLSPGQLSAAVVTDTTVSLTWIDNADNETGFVLERRLQAGTVADYISIASLVANATDYDDSVSPSTDYSYRIKATNSAGESAYSAELAVSSAAVAVAAPSNLTADAVTDKTVDLSWTDNASNETEYRVERREPSGPVTGYIIIGTLAADSTSFRDDNVSADTSYFYRTQALSTTAMSGYSNEIQVTTDVAPPLPTDVFAKSYGTNLDAKANDIIQTSDGGYVIAGNVDVDSSLVFNGDLLLAKTDATGMVEWTRAYDNSLNDEAFSIAVTPDDGYIVVGITGGTFSDVWALKLDAAGDIEWEFAYGVGADRFGHAVTAVDADADGMADDGFLIVGNAAVPSASALAIRLNSQGTVLWQRTFIAANSSAAYSVQQTTSGDFVIAGELYVDSGRSSYWVMKLDPSGNTIWQRSFVAVASGTGIAKALSVRQTDDDNDGVRDDGFIVAGYADFDDSSVFRYDAWVIKLTTDGDISWQKRYGDTSFDEVVADAEIDSDGNLVIAGDTLNDFLLLKIDNDGNVLTQKTYGGISGDSADAIAATNDGGVAITGSVAFEVGHRDAWLLKLDTSADIQFAPGNNVTSADTTFSGVDTLSTSATTTVNPDTTIISGNAVTPTASQPALTVTTQSF